MNNDYEILGEYAKQGYFLKEYADHTITVCYKDNGSKELVAFDQSLATPEALQDVCRRHQMQLIEKSVSFPFGW